MTTVDKEEARLYAESKMYEGWNRRDGIEIAVFYNHMVDFLVEELRKAKAWIAYDDWKSYNYTYEDYSEKYYKGGADTGIVPLSREYTEYELRQEYKKINNL